MLMDIFRIIFLYNRYLGEDILKKNNMLIWYRQNKKSHEKGNTAYARTQMKNLLNSLKEKEMTQQR